MQIVLVPNRFTHCWYDDWEMKLWYGVYKSCLQTMLQHVDLRCLQQCPVSYSTGAAGNSHLRRQEEFWWSITFYSENATIKKRRKKNNRIMFNFSVICASLEENFQEKVASSGEIKQQLPIAQILLLRDSVPNHAHSNCPQDQGVGLWWVDLNQQPNTYTSSGSPLCCRMGRRWEEGTQIKAVRLVKQKLHTQEKQKEEFVYFIPSATDVFPPPGNQGFITCKG